MFAGSLAGTNRLNRKCGRIRRIQFRALDKRHGCRQRFQVRIILRPGHFLYPHPGNSTAYKIELPGRLARQVDNPAPPERPPVVDTHHDPFSVRQVGYPYIRTERKGAVRRHQAVPVVYLAACRSPPVKPVVVKRGDAFFLLRIDPVPKETNKKQTEYPAAERRHFQYSFLFQFISSHCSSSP